MYAPTPSLINGLFQCTDLSTETIYRISLSKLAQRQALRTMGGSSFIGIGGSIGLQDLKEDDSEDA